MKNIIDGWLLEQRYGNKKSGLQHSLRDELMNGGEGKENPYEAVSEMDKKF